MRFSGTTGATPASSPAATDIRDELFGGKAGTTASSVNEVFNEPGQLSASLTATSNDARDGRGGATNGRLSDGETTLLRLGGRAGDASPLK